MPLHPSTRRSPWLFRVTLVLGGVALAVGLVFAAELAARVLDPLTPQEQTDRNAFDYQAWTLGPCYRESFGRLVPVRPETELHDPGGEAGETFPLKKPEGVRRIVVVGESTGEMLERKLAELTRGCHDRVEILRCSAAGSRPYLAVRRVEQALAWSPDQIVVAIGHNFMLPGVPTMRQLDINRSRLIHEVHRLVPSPPPPGPAAPKVGLEAMDDFDPPSMGHEAYKQILKLTQAKGVSVVALVLASNLWYRPNMEPGYATAPERARAWVKWAEGDAAGAVELLKANGADGAMRAYERAHFLAEAGNWTLARTELEHARDIEAMPTRASSAVTAGIEDAARQGRARLIDVDALFAPLADHGMPGWDVFFDNCHPHPPALDRLARTVLAATAPDAAAACLSGPPLPEPTKADPFSRLVDGPTRVQLPDEKADLETVRRRVEGPFTTLIRREPGEAANDLKRYDSEVLTKGPVAVRVSMLTAISETARDLGRFDLARWSLDQSITTQPTAAALADRALLEHRDHQDTEAGADVQKALALDPTYPLAKALSEALAKAGPH
jgi:hypothetical protein